MPFDTINSTRSNKEEDARNEIKDRDFSPGFLPLLVVHATFYFTNGSNVSICPRVKRARCSRIRRGPLHRLGFFPKILAVERKLRAEQRGLLSWGWKGIARTRRVLVDPCHCLREVIRETGFADLIGRFAAALARFFFSRTCWLIPDFLAWWISSFSRANSLSRSAKRKRASFLDRGKRASTLNLPTLCYTHFVD